MHHKRRASRTPRVTLTMEYGRPSTCFHAHLALAKVVMAAAPSVFRRGGRVFSCTHGPSGCCPTGAVSHFCQIPGLVFGVCTHGWTENSPS